ncbi:DNA (cytosine-5-)-methyltransferase [Proteus genomosp. 4]|uniref:DNA (cytosine-5-)-methyltransferase n=1 Tax=Proteus genomosp. 4 TaxID=1311818 RepID=UPI000D68B7C4|nr:DNA (cytosine-5-)-methyltransferase [Proteus genomosp. 4]
MIYLSLFNGISAGRLALSRAGIKFDKYYIAEIDKFANKVSEFHYPDNIQLGDVNNWREWDIDWSSVGLVTAGFPCQSWSLAGKQLGDKDERGKLFWTTLEIMNHVLENNPDAKFMLENVKMKKEFEEYITLHTERALGYVNKTLINSSLLSAQNRQRYYWTNFEVSQPEDKGIFLKDIIENINSSNRPYEKRNNINSRQSELMHIGNAVDIKGNETILRVYSTDGKSPTLSTCQGGHRQPKIALDCNNYRKLTATEFARLQTFPDGWCENIVSNSQSYKCYGNAWTVDVIAHIFKCAYRENKHEAIRPTVNYEQSCSANI